MSTILTIVAQAAPPADALARLRAAGVPNTLRIAPFNPTSRTWGAHLTLSESAPSDVTAALTVGWVLGVVGLPMSTAVEFTIEEAP